MREDRTYGLEGGAAETTRPFLPLSRQLDLGAFQSLQACKATSWDFVPPDQDPVPPRGGHVIYFGSLGNLGFRPAFPSSGLPGTRYSFWNYRV